KNPTLIQVLVTLLLVSPATQSCLSPAWSNLLEFPPLAPDPGLFSHRIYGPTENGPSLKQTTISHPADSSFRSPAVAGSCGNNLCAESLKYPASWRDQDRLALRDALCSRARKLCLHCWDRLRKWQRDVFAREQNLAISEARCCKSCLLLWYRLFANEVPPLP